MSIYDSLNKEQRLAVEHDRGPLLILAGAGSGKTRVLTHRIAYLIEETGVNPYQILALTFTNKAAREMRDRVNNLVGQGSENIWVSTFHSTCVRILRRFIESLGYDRSFTIYDTDDQKTLMKQICKYLDIDTKNIKEKSILSAISKAKDSLISPDDFALTALSPIEKKYAAAYKEYQKRLKAANALDFDDLIYQTVTLFRTDQHALEVYQKRFRYIMVDEYQDTNTVQFILLSLLASSINEYGETEHNLCVVGDDDQSIYKFRGANIRNILDFEKLYPNTKVIHLEQNYRSTQNILNAANEVIRNNEERKEKSLWTENEEGSPVAFSNYDSDLMEASSIIDQIDQMATQKKADYKDFAILYRTNAQSRVFEEKLIAKGIPYKIVGSINFYQRKEIKDLLAYLRTIENGKDDIAVRRIINVPKRGIGLTTIDRIADYAIQRGISFYEALRQADFIPSIARSAKKIQSFVGLIEGIRAALLRGELLLKDLIDEILESTGYIEELKDSEDENSEDRVSNINELISKIISFDEESMEPRTLGEFLEEIALVADIDHLSESNEVVVLMTLHSAKGLEFPYVFLCGMEEGIFPSSMAIYGEHPAEDIEEERRLCYVGITRARQCLYLSAAKQRMQRGETQYNRPSRFISEIPRHLLSVKAQAPNHFIGGGEKYGNSPIRNGKPSFKQPDLNKVYHPAPARDFGSSTAAPDYQAGDTVQHIKFGTGKVTDIVRGGKDFEVTVDFGSKGIKKMLAAFANLRKI